MMCWITFREKKSNGDKLTVAILLKSLSLTCFISAFVCPPKAAEPKSIKSSSVDTLYKGYNLRSEASLMLHSLNPHRKLNLPFLHLWPTCHVLNQFPVCPLIASHVKQGIDTSGCLRCSSTAKLKRSTKTRDGSVKRTHCSYCFSFGALARLRFRRLSP